MAYDECYWYRYDTRRTQIQDLYVSEITALELCRSNEIPYIAALYDIGEARRRFYGKSIPVIKDRSYLGQLRYETNGVPNPSANVFHLLPKSSSVVRQSKAASPWSNACAESQFIATMTGIRTVRLPRAPRRVLLAGTVPQFTPNSDGGPPDWVVVPEGISAIPILEELASPKIGVMPILEGPSSPTVCTSLTIPEGCFTDDLLSMMPDESGAGVAGTEGRGTPVGSTPASPSSSLLQGEIHDRATYGPDMAVEDLVTPEVAVPSPAQDTTRGKRGSSGSEAPPRMLRARRAMDGGVSTMGPAGAEAQHAGAGSGPTHQG